MRLTPGQLNRTLWQRQGLMARLTGSAHAVCADLVGLQAQENRSPFLGLAVRLAGFDPTTVTEGLESRTLRRPGGRLRLFRTLTSAEWAGLDAEVARADALLAR